MGHIINYVKEIHDFYLYDSEPILDWSGNTFSWAKPIAYNTNVYLKNIKSYVPDSNLPTEIDLSGIIARRRGVTVYFSESNKPYTFYFSGFQSTGNQYPSGNDNLRDWLITDGWCGAYLNLRDDYNHWNNGEPPGCLISPMHILVGGHMIDPLFEARNDDSTYILKSYSDEELGPTNNPFIKLRFLGKDNTIYEKIAFLSFFFNDNTGGPGLNCQNEGTTVGEYDSNYCQNYVDNLNNNFGAGKDLAILELSVPFTEEELKNLKIYKIANFKTWPNDSPVFQVTPNGVLLLWKKNAALSQSQPYYDNNIYPEIPVNGYQLLDGLGGKIPVQQSVQFYGDSCNFMYGYYPPTKEIVLLGATNTGGAYFQYTNNILYDTVFLKALKEWIYQRTLLVTGKGYKIDWIDYSENSAGIEVENSVYPVGSTLSSDTTQVFYTGFTLPGVSYQFIEGITYSFLVTAVNSFGFSGFAGPLNTRIS